MSFMQYFISCSGATPFLFILFLPLGKAYQDGFRMAHDPSVNGTLLAPWKIVDKKTSDTVRKFRARWLIGTAALLMCQAAASHILYSKKTDAGVGLQSPFLFAFLCFGLGSIPIIVTLYFMLSPHIKGRGLLLFVSYILYLPFSLYFPLFFLYFVDFSAIKLGFVELIPGQLDEREYHVIPYNVYIVILSIIVSLVIFVLCHYIRKGYRRFYNWNLAAR